MVCYLKVAPCAVRSEDFRFHMNGTARTFSYAEGAAFAVVIVEFEAFAGPELDDSIVRTDTVTVVTFETVATGQAAACFKLRIGFVETTLHFFKG